MDKISIEYIFKFPCGEPRSYCVQLDKHTLEYIDDAAQTLPEWTVLTSHQCPNCPLNIASSPYCPIAVNLVKLVDMCQDVNSYEQLELTIVTAERNVSSTTTAQHGISSLFGLIMAASPCPHTQYFKPMARYHLPLASQEETLYRAASMYLLAQYFRSKQGQKADFELQGLSEVYRNMQTVNAALAKRLKAAISNDSTINAIILLDLFAKTIPYDLDDSLDEMNNLFQSYLSWVP